MSHIKVSAVVVTYNRVKLLKGCIKNLLNQSYELHRIIIINNNSSDGTNNYLSSIHNPKIISVNTHKNLGGAGGFSLGTKLAFERTSSDYFWLMDDDTMPEKNALKALIDASSRLDGKFGYLSSNVRWWKDNAPSYRNIPCINYNWPKFSNEGLIELKFSSFVSLFVPRKMVKNYGLPIADMFIWGDDVEYTTRLSKRYPSYFVTNSIVLHKSASNPKQDMIFNAPVSRFKYYKCMFRNRLFISRKFYNLKKTIKLLILYTLFLLEIPFKSKSHKIKRSLCVVSGIINGLHFYPKVRFPKDNSDSVRR